MCEGIIGEKADGLLGLAVAKKEEEREKEDYFFHGNLILFCCNGFVYWGNVFGGVLSKVLLLKVSFCLGAYLIANKLRYFLLKIKKILGEAVLLAVAQLEAAPQLANHLGWNAIAFTEPSFLATCGCSVNAIAFKPNRIVGLWPLPHPINTTDGVPVLEPA